MENVEYRYGKVAYCLLAFFLGGLGLHSFYAKKNKEGVFFIIASVIRTALKIGGRRIGNSSMVLLGSLMGLVLFGFIIYQIIVAVRKETDEFGKIS